MLVHFPKKYFKNKKMMLKWVGSAPTLPLVDVQSYLQWAVPVRRALCEGEVVSRKEERIGSPVNWEAPPNEICPSRANAKFSLF